MVILYPVDFSKFCFIASKLSQVEKESLKPACSGGWFSKMYNLIFNVRRKYFIYYK